MLKPVCFAALGLGATLAGTVQAAPPYPASTAITGIRWDIGSYEFVNPLSDSDGDWLTDTDEAAAGTGLLIPDTDGDLMGDGAETRAGTDPLNAASFLSLGSVAWETSTGIVVRWSGASGRFYRLNRSTNLRADTFSIVIRSNIPAAYPAVNVETDATATGPGPWFYRLGVE
jgi:hypothetical protein